MKKYTLTEMKRKKWKRRSDKKQLGCKFIRLNPDAENYDIFVEISRTKNHIIESNQKSLINKISRRLLESEFEENQSV